MTQTNPTTAHKHVVSLHETMLWQSQYARITVRKAAGLYNVRLEDYDNGNVIRSQFKTLRGALICADGYRAGYL